MLRNNVRKLLELRGESRYRFWQNTQISQKTAYLVVNDPYYPMTSKIIEAICKAYNVQPGDILIYETAEANSEKRSGDFSNDLVKKITA